MNEAREYGERINKAMIQVVEQARWDKRFRSARALADAAGMTHTYLNQRLNGTTNFSVRDLGALAHALGVPIGELLDRALLLASDESDPDENVEPFAADEIGPSIADEQDGHHRT